MTNTDKRPVGGTSMTFAVLVDDNFHYMDTSARYKLGEYETYEAAVAACKAIVDEALAENYVKGMRADELYQRYVTFGEDPWVTPTPEGEHFSAWDYAKQQCTERAGPLTNPGKSVSDWPLDLSGDNLLVALGKKVNDARGEALIRKNYPDLVHLLEEDREPNKEPETTLPKFSAHRYSATGQMFFASRGGTGFAPKDVFGPVDEAMTPDDWNEKNGVTKADAAAMLAGTMIGWDGPLAQASNYDADGHLIDETFKNCSDAQILQARLECHSKTFLDWPHDLSGDNLLKALNIVEERFKAYRQPQEVDSRIHPPIEKPHPLEGVQVVRLGISESELVRLRAERGPLSDALVRRIERVMPVFKDLYTPVFKGGSASLRDEWIEGFNLDLHPEWEVAYWEWLAESLLIFSRSEVLTFEQFKEAYDLLMSAYNKGKVAAMKEANLQLFTADQVEYLLSGCSRVGDQGKPPGREGVRKFQD